MFVLMQNFNSKLFFFQKITTFYIYETFNLKCIYFFINWYDHKLIFKIPIQKHIIFDF